MDEKTSANKRQTLNINDMLPIETAPMDESAPPRPEVLLKTPSGFFVGYYGGWNGWRLKGGGCPVLDPQPTHWMPLPKANHSVYTFKKQHEIMKESLGFIAGQKDLSGNWAVEFAKSILKELGMD